MYINDVFNQITNIKHEYVHHEREKLSNKKKTYMLGSTTIRHSYRLVLAFFSRPEGSELTR